MSNDPQPVAPLSTEIVAELRHLDEVFNAPHGGPGTDPDDYPDLRAIRSKIFTLLYRHMPELLSAWDDHARLTQAVGEHGTAQEANARHARCIGELKAAEARAEAAERERDHWKLEYERNKFDLNQWSQFASGNYWAWQGDGSDHIESLTCPVVIQPRDLKAILQELATVKAWIEFSSTFPDEHVAWLRYTEGGSIVTCDSDAPKAFRVYKRPAAVEARPAELAAAQAKLAAS